MENDLYHRCKAWLSAPNTYIPPGLPRVCAAYVETVDDLRKAPTMYSVLVRAVNDDRLMEAFARGYEAESAAQMGEPSPFSIDGGNDDKADFLEGRLHCARAGVAMVLNKLNAMDDV